MSAYLTIYNNSRKTFAPIFQKEIDKQVRAIVEGLTPPTKGLKDAIRKCHASVGVLMAYRSHRDIMRSVKKGMTPQQVWQQVILEYLDLHGLDQVTKEITQTTIDDITKMLEKIGLNGWNVNQIIAHIESIGYSAYRGELIARTETSKAANTGAMVGALSTGLDTRKEWIAVQDGRTRQIPRDQYDHFNMDGVQVGMDEYFHVPQKNGGFQKMLHPGDPSGSAGDVCNCRCTVGFEALRDANGKPIQRTSAPLGNAGILYNIIQSKNVFA
jgi:uncharacterized protein with gpF-like domain